VARILIVDDQPNIRKVFASILAEDGHQVLEAAGVADARAQVATLPLDLVLTDQRMPDGTGLDLLAACVATAPGIPVVLVSAYASVELAVTAMRAGAFDVLPKPFDPDQVMAVVRRALEHARLLRENARLRDQLDRLSGTREIIGSSSPMVALRERMARVGPTDATVLIVGETGSGKELVARALHDMSSRAGGAFIAVNCAGLPENLLESELFGHERGAFTGADRARQGVFEAADGGTLFLDEAGEMSLGLQAKLLRVLMSGELTRVGSTTPIRVDVRLLAATHRDLHEMVHDGRFREDLYYRLAVVPLEVPPLRARADDLPELIRHLLGTVAVDLKLAPKTVTNEAMARLASYGFPGNVRELRNLLERATILCQGESIDAADLGLGTADDEMDSIATCVASLGDDLDLRRLLEQIEKRIVTRTLVASGGVQAEAARRLGISRSDLSYKLRRLGLRDEPRSNS
jgi:two-component system response regulator HydG